MSLKFWMFADLYLFRFKAMQHLFVKMSPECVLSLNNVDCP